MTIIVTDNFETKLGTIRTWIEVDDDALILSQNDCKTVTKGHEINIQPFELTDIQLPEGMQYETSKGWRWFIAKTSTQTEQLTIFCKLINPTSDTEYDSSSGEHLDAIEIENKTHHLHIGTEDGEIMGHRAKESDWMPKRFEKEIGYHKSFTQYVDFGFKTTIPDLKEYEKIYFHFLVATNPIRQSKEYPNERDVSTWYAVDQPKRFLDDRLKKYGR